MDNFIQNDAGLLVPDHKLLMGGSFHAELIRANEIIDEWDFDNTVVNEGLNSALNVVFNGASPITSWYVGLFQGNYTPVPSDTAATIAANSTESSAYAAGVRQPFVTVTSTAQLITNSASKASFTFSSGATIYGAFLASTATINGVSGVLMSAARFSTSRVVASGDELLLTYSFSAASV
jgi:hypothetical protein